MARKMVNTRFWTQKHPLLLYAGVALIVGLRNSCTAEVRAEDIADKRITCDAPSVIPGNSTSIVCHFLEDINQTRRNFFVSFYKGDKKEEAVNVLACLWVLEETRCFVWPGYKYDGRISQEISLKIPRASANQVGRYECQVDTYDYNITPCEFRVRLEGKAQCYIESAAMSSNTSLTCFFPEDLSETKAEAAVYHHTRRGAESLEVMSCVWKGEIVDCTASRGYELDGSVTDHMTVRIPSVVKSHEGHYSCQTTGLRSHRYGDCYLGLEQVSTELITSACNISSVKEMDPTALTCTFSVNIKATRKNFEVVRLDSDGRKAARIITCIWMDEKLVCTTASGYLFNSDVTDYFVIRIPKALRVHNGTYSCHVMGVEPDEFSSCEFIVSTGRKTPVCVTLMITSFTLRQTETHQQLFTQATANARDCYLFATWRRIPANEFSTGI
ncbi:uncharacterized protein LOC112574806 [Pomacea canaliculata]|uniref:uncharacterized protein LOC112574806 n=1 Tax=Pomacea canaliculata TaxID=400727 RepID=UPI000D733820|nr:uncharacterized protein LOC112574806 [Pomacea canaliculata]